MCLLHASVIALATAAAIATATATASVTATATATATAASFVVHQFPGGGTAGSPWYEVGLGPQPSSHPSFVWFTSVKNRQPICPGSNVPHTSTNKDTSFSMFDLHAPTKVTVALRQWNVSKARVLPTSAGVSATIAPGGSTLTFTLEKPRQVCLVVDDDYDKPLCIFADPPESGQPDGPSKDVIYFGPGTHAPGEISVATGQTVYLAGGAHVYGQVVGLNSSQWPGSCDGVRIMGRGVLDGHAIPIGHNASAMIDVKSCANVIVEGITTVDSPFYQIRNYAMGGRISFAKAIAWGFSTDGWSAGQYSMVEDSFNKVLLALALALGALPPCSH